MKRYISMVLASSMFFGCASTTIIFLLPPGNAFSEEIKTEEPKAIEGREVLGESALSLPQGSNRISIATQYTRGGRERLRTGNSYPE